MVQCSPDYVLRTADYAKFALQGTATLQRAAAWLCVGPRGGKQPVMVPPCDSATLVLLQEIAQLKTRSALELHAKELEVAGLQQQLARHEADK